MDMVVWPGSASGIVAAPSSKSEAHRLLICAALADKPSEVVCPTLSDDVHATVQCLRALGAQIEVSGTTLTVEPLPRSNKGIPCALPQAELDCGESGSTLRFLLPVVAALGKGAAITAHGRLPNRPLSPLYERLIEGGATLSQQGEVPLIVGGTLHAGSYELPGDVSSQYVTGLLLAACALRDRIEVVVRTPVESIPYIDITVAALKAFGVDVQDYDGITSDGHKAHCWVADARNSLSAPSRVEARGDWSNGAFWLALSALGHSIEVANLDVTTTQGDRWILEGLGTLGHGLISSSEQLQCSGNTGHAATLDVTNCPDLVPPLAAVAALCPGTTHIIGAARLALKESNRLATVSAVINSLGGSACPHADGIIIEGTSQPLPGGVVDAAGDHRIAMMAAILATRTSTPTTICGAECVSKSYPGFFDDLRALGIRAEVKECA